MPTLEINGTFYALQRPDSFRTWHDSTPSDFVFSVKAPRFITHMKRLVDVEAPVANFLASGVLALRDKLGPILWQLPPNFRFDPERLREFFSQLPRSTAQAALMARRHDERMEGRALTETDRDRPLRHALEVRHSSFATTAFTELLREHEIAVVVADTAGRWPHIREMTTDFSYVRLHGDQELYASGYTDQALRGWASTITSRAESGNDVYAYFDNDIKVHSPFDALKLAAMIG
jgi:uncharacterized protein YecE (DUF72 family)